MRHGFLSGLHGSLDAADEVVEVRLRGRRVNIVRSADRDSIWELTRQILHGGEERVDIFRLDVRMLINSRSEIRTLRPDDTLRSREHRSAPHGHDAWVEHIHRLLHVRKAAAESPSEDRQCG